jgi:Holliday junction resolvase-like predicted endonuclease
MNISTKTTKEIGLLGENAACAYLKKEGFTLRERNVVSKTGEIDVIAQKEIRSILLK